MDKALFTDKQIATLKEGFGKTKKVDPVKFNEQTDKIFKGMTSDAVCQLARAGIAFLSTAAYFEAKKRGIVIEGWKVSNVG